MCAECGCFERRDGKPYCRRLKQYVPYRPASCVTEAAEKQWRREIEAIPAGVRRREDFYTHMDETWG